jgi:hypothetical protein
VSDYASRQQVQQQAERTLAEADRPITRLPELSPPMDLGNLFELAAALDVQEWV